MSQTNSGGLPGVTANNRNRILKSVLKGVSRSFYLTLRVLPKNLRESIGLAYLLARAADTIADRKHSGLRGSRLEGLLTLRVQVAGPADLATLQELSAKSVDTLSSPKDRALFSSLVESFSMLESMNLADREQVRWVVGTLIEGMEMDLDVFAGQDSRHLTSFSTAADLDRYTYLVAGCVGEFWTKVTTANEPGLFHWDTAEMSQKGVMFGKGLQLTNILRDIPGDLRMGRCYLPADELAASGLTPEDLLDQSNEERARQVLVPWVQTALGHFEAAEDYLLAIPRRSVRLRLACLWPLLLGLATLARLARSKNWLERDSEIKVSRRWVYRMVFTSLFTVRSDRLLRRWIRHLHQQVESAI
jgi:farnesyl-diphosphate farnesyltransferase